MEDFENQMINMKEELNTVNQVVNVNCLAEVFGIQNKEVYITKWLAYLLSQPSIGVMILNSFMQIINDETIIVDNNKVHSEYDLGAAGRIDIYVESDDYIIGIENKIWASEGEKQTRKYWDELSRIKDKKIIPIYLHPEMNSSIPECDEFYNITYTQLINKLKDQDIDHSNEFNGFLYNEFIKYVEVCLSMQYPKMTKEAEIYQKYLESIQSAKDEYTDYTNQVENWVANKITEKGYIVNRHSNGNYWQIVKNKEWYSINFHFEILWDSDFVNSKLLNIQAHLEGNRIKEDETLRNSFHLEDNKPRGVKAPLAKDTITDYDFKSEENTEKIINEIISILESEEFTKYAEYANKYLKP